MLDQTLSSSQFYIDGFSLPYRLDRNCNGRGTMIFVKKDILSKLLRQHIFASDFEGLFVKIKYRKTKLKKKNLSPFCRKMFSILLFVLIQLLVFAVTMIIFYLQKILMQKKDILAWVLFCINIISIIFLKQVLVLKIPLNQHPLISS